MKCLLSSLLLAYCLTAAAQAPKGALSHKQLDSMARNMGPVPGKALVYIVRPEIYDAAAKTRISVDSFLVGWMPIRSYLYTVMDPGVHVFKLNSYDDAGISLSLEAGKIYFLDHRDPFISRKTGFKVIAEAEGRKALGKCMISRYNTYPDFPLLKYNMREP